MFDIRLNEDQRAFQRLAREFAENEIPPKMEAMEETQYDRLYRVTVKGDTVSIDLLDQPTLFNPD